MKKNKINDDEKHFFRYLWKKDCIERSYRMRSRLLNPLKRVSMFFRFAEKFVFSTTVPIRLSIVLNGYRCCVMCVYISNGYRVVSTITWLSDSFDANHFKWFCSRIIVRIHTLVDWQWTTTCVWKYTVERPTKRRILYKCIRTYIYICSLTTSRL